ncbi:MAG: helix-hairpin-helix domain-containing protein [Alistipes sp.]|nr:helix-hairpin-helix domain-containing protein [Alistipes sp.]
MSRIRVDKSFIVSVVALLTACGMFMAAIALSRRGATVPETTPTAECDTLTTDSLRCFDPNTVSYEQLRRFGVEPHTARSILKFRARGGVFEIAEDLTLCYGITDSIFYALRPYIAIGEQYRPKPFERHKTAKDSVEIARKQALREAQAKQWEQKISRRRPHPYEPFRLDTVGMEYLLGIGFTFRQAEGLLEYRDRGLEGIRNMTELRDCWAVTPQMADSLERFVVFPDPKPYGGKVEINSADSVSLVRLRGIGAVTAQAIVEYRKLLGGYCNINQLLELKCVTEENFALFSKQICCDSCVFSKIDINFATASEMELHPYMTRRAINTIIELRKSKGGWKSFEEIVKQNIFTTEQAKAIAPYLHFGETPRDLSINKPKGGHAME